MPPADEHDHLLPALASACPPDGALRVLGWDDLIAAVPYLLGFHPADSLVLVGLAGGGVRVTARLDLVDAGPRTVPEVVARLVGAGVDSVLALAFTSHPLDFDDEVQRRWCDALARSAAERGCELYDLVAVHGDRRRSWRCHLSGCLDCDPAGEPLDPSSSVVAAAATYRGLTAWPDREAMIALLDPVADRERLLPVLDRHEDAATQAALGGRLDRYQRSAKRALFAAARAAEGHAAPLSDDTVARFGVALSAVTVRDALWLAIDDGRLDGRALWLDLARRLPAGYDASALFLAGWAYWRAGNGALAHEAAVRAMHSDPACTAAGLLLSAVEAGFDPATVPKLRGRRSA